LLAHGVHEDDNALLSQVMYDSLTNDVTDDVMTPVTTDYPQWIVHGYC